jgi:Ca-activated chloride channel family protein
MPMTDPFGRRKLVRVKVDIDEDTLTKVAEKTGAVYFRATDTASLTKIYDEINSMETTTKTIKKFENYRELFPFLLAAALFLLGLEIFSTRKRLP